MRLHAFVSGFVQGVFFRSTTRELACSLGLRGFVRNLPDGSVEVVAEGGRKELDKLLSFLKAGPEGARVDKVDFKFEETEEGFTEFSVA